MDHSFDPRSAGFNTEIGFVIDFPLLPRSIADSFARNMPEHAYEVRLAPHGTLCWVERSGETGVVLDQEPGAGL